jgi:peroxiredoxin
LFFILGNPEGPDGSLNRQVAFLRTQENDKMAANYHSFPALLVCVSAGLLLGACSPNPGIPAAGGTPSATGKPSTTEAPAASETPLPEWFALEMKDVNSGATFTINDFSGKVVLLSTMAQWCPNCLIQQAYIHKMYGQLGHPENLVLVSLDVDVNEDEESLKQFTDEYGFDWRFAVSPLMVSRALGNLYTAQYLNPPLDPAMIIDRRGNVHHLPYGIKDADTLQQDVEPYLAD